MKVVAVLGSPRVKGNSALVAERFLEAARRRGAETQSFALNTLSYRGCQACRACKKHLDRCVLKDDLTGVLDAVREADVTVLASPVYYGDVTGQMKLFIDRTYCFLGPDYLVSPDASRLAPGKRMVFILTQGMADESGFADIYPRYSMMMKFNGIADTYLIRACGLAKPEEVLQRPEVLRQAEELAERLLG